MLDLRNNSYGDTALNIGIVGTGWVTTKHLEALKPIEGARVTAIAGRNETRASELAKPFGAASYTRWETMLAKEKLDVVFILLPPHLHGELERACSEHVKGVLIEKPITQSLQTAMDINGYFKKAGTIVSVAYMNRYRQSVEQARVMLAGPENQAILADGWWITPMPPPPWWRAFDQSGGQFVEQCTHLVDVCRYVMGDITDVSAFAARGFITGVPDYTVDDAMVVTARFASGALGTFSTGCFPQADHRHTPDGGVGVSLCSRQRRILLQGWGLSATVFGGNEAPQTVAPEPDVFTTQARAFLAAVQTNDPSLIRSSYEDGMKTLAVTLAATESARTRNGAPVKVAL